MKVAPIPDNEASRLEALESYGVLDTDPEGDYDDLTHLASHLCGTPIALMSLVDARRQWFKSSVGLDVRETHRDYAFCAHTLEKGEWMEIPDATKDARFSDNPLVMDDPNIRFYAGAPLKSPDGHVLGTLCVIDYVPRQLSGRQRHSLEALSRMIMRHLNMRLINVELKTKQKAIETLLEQKSQLMDVVSHDMRGPLAGITGFANLLMEDLRGTSPSLEFEQKVDFLKEIIGCADSALQLLSDFLSAESLQEPHLQARIGQVRTAELVEELQRRSAGHARRKRIDLEFDTQGLEAVGCDRRLFLEVLDNLVSNAVKYSPQGSKVLLKGRQLSDGSTQFSITDQGPGFTSEDRKSLFKRFKRLSAQPTGGEASSGLGLSIVKHLVDLHQGTIELASKKGRGATFVVTLPCYTPPTKRNGSAA